MRALDPARNAHCRCTRTACGGEVCGAAWNEFDLEEGVWTHFRRTNESEAGAPPGAVSPGARTRQKAEGTEAA